MAVISGNRGKFVRKGSLEAVKICDYSGLWFSESDIVASSEWRGSNLVPTGFYVGKKFLNEPNSQNRTPKVSNDPQSVNLARPLNNGDRMEYDSPSSPQVKRRLDEFNYTKPPAFNDGLPNSATNPPLLNIGGTNVSGINAEERLKMLHAIPMS